MKKNLLLTCLLTLAAVFGMAQTKATFPITLTEAEGLPGPFVVQNYLFTSDVYTVDQPVQKIRMTVCNTNTANNIGRGSHDGISAYNGTGQPFFTMSEVRFFDENGDAIEFVATGNSVDPGDGGGYAALSDKDETTYLHTNYGGRCESMPAEYHYVEFELEKEVSTFQFTIQTRSRYYKNLITYMGVTAGSIDATDEELFYLPYPEQEFKMGEKVTDVADLAASGALFVIQGTADDYTYDYEFTLAGNPNVVTHTMPGNLYMRSPYEGSITPSAASVFYLKPDADGLEDTYRVCWLNSGRYIAYHTGGNDIWTSWTREISEAASLTFAPCDTAAGNFWISLPAKGKDENDETVDCTAWLGYDGYGRMDYISNAHDSVFLKTARPHSYNWAIYNATINGSAISARLQAEIDEAQARIDAIGGKIEGQDEGEYDALVAAVNLAKMVVANPNVAAGDIISMATSLRTLTVAYASVGLWAYADTINKIDELVQNEVIPVCSAPEWVPGAYLQSAYDKLVAYIDEIDEITQGCESLADVDRGIENLYAQVDAFWASKISKDANITEIPFRIGRPEEGLPGVNTNSIFRWESPKYYFTEELDAIRMTVFKTKQMRTLNGKPFVCLTELEFYDLSGKKIQLTGDSYYTPSVAGEGSGLAGLCDGQTTTGTHFHSQWGADDDYDGSEYFYLDITFPEPIAGFTYVQYGRGNGYDDVPTDFVFGYADEMVTPDDVAFPVVEDPNGAVLGEQVTDVAEITDDALYAIVGNWNSAPEGSGTSRPIFYTGINFYSAVEDGFGAPCAYRITKTDNDSTFNIFSLATGKYLMNNGGPGAYYTGHTYDIERAAQVRIVPSAPLREEIGAEEFENAFLIYQYIDTIQKEVDEYNEELDSTVKVMKPHPYLYLNSWGGEGNGRLVWRAMYGPGEYAKVNDDGSLPFFQGELEWNIFKMTMDNPNLYWLQSVYDEASSIDLIVGSDPGYYTAEPLKPFTEALVQAQAALESEDESLAAATAKSLSASVQLLDSAERNPVIAGTYVIEADDARYLQNIGHKVAVCAYFNPFEMYSGELSTSSEYSLWWTYAPEDYSDVKAIDNMFKFQLVPAVITEDAPEGSIYSEELVAWYEDSVVTEEQLANAFFIKSLKTGQYAGVSELVDANTGIPRTSNNIGFTDEPLYPYIIREQGAYKFDIWCPVGPNNCFHQENHGNGGGQPSHIVHWNGGSGVQASLWQLRALDTGTSIDDIVTDDAEGDVVSVAYYTVDGVAVAAPVKGVNIVKTTYANGVVKTVKEFVK